MDDPVRHERLAAIGKNGTQIRLHKKRMTFYFVYLSDWKTKCIVPEMTQFSPITTCFSLFATKLTIAQMAKTKAFLCKINKIV